MSGSARGGPGRPERDVTLPGPGEAPSSEAPPERDSLWDLVGVIVAGRYELEEPIGHGGLGRVFRAKHVVLGKEFALKILNTTLSGDSVRRERFYHEAQLASSMMHPNIVSVVDFGEDELVGAFMVMEYVQGEPLSARLERYPSGLPVKVVCDVIRQLSDALRHVHRRDVAHGDIKPDNVLCYQVSVIGSKRRQWQVKLVDFGMAFLRTSNEDPGEIGGTPAYIAPERIQGDAPSASSDLYSLGLVAYELLTGAVPFAGTTQEVLFAQLESEPPPIGERRGEEVDERVDQLVRRAIAKDPAKRHESIDAFIYELRTVMHMLGMTDRKWSMSTTGIERTADRRLVAAAAGFDLAPYPMAGINVDGAIVVANTEFARFLTGDGSATLSADALFSSPLYELYPTLLRDLRRVHVSGARRHKLLAVEKRGERTQLRFTMSPGRSGSFGDVHVTVIAEHAPTDGDDR